MSPRLMFWKSRFKTIKRKCKKVN